jgi:hypothetical protein
MKNLGNTIYSFSCVLAATLLGIGVADYWFGHHQLTAFLSWAVLAAIPWLVGRASLYVLARRPPGPHQIGAGTPAERLREEAQALLGEFERR